MLTIHVTITGRVQGVGYRNWAVSAARKLALTGWVRNRADGSVEALFTGPEENVRVMLEQCKKGPFLARVSEVRSAPAEADANAQGFTQLPTL